MRLPCDRIGSTGARRVGHYKMPTPTGVPRGIGMHFGSRFGQALSPMENPIDQTFFGCSYKTILDGIRRPNSIRFCLALGRQEVDKLYDDRWVCQCLKELEETENVRLSARTVLIRFKRDGAVKWFGSARDAIASLALSAACFPAVHRSSRRIQPDVEFSAPLLSDVSHFSWGEKDNFRHYARRFARETRKIGGKP